jgi:hypothetical protein
MRMKTWGQAIPAAVLAASSICTQTPGLRIFSPTGANQTQLVDTQGTIVHSWPGTAATTVHMLDDGSLIRGMQTGTFTIGGATGRLQQIGYDGTVSWDVLIDGPNHYMHHDVEPMPNGNILVIAWDAMSVADAIAAGRDPTLSSGSGWFPDAILEVEKTGPASANIVWEWHIMDHVIQDYDPSQSNHGVIAAHPELLDINYPPVPLANGDWNHGNGLDYDPINDWIIFSSRSQAEIYLIDHSTTSQEAAGHTGGQRGKGGDILFRWGNPHAYGAGSSADQQLFGQHDPRFIPPSHPGAGHITLFNNNYQPTQSAVFELALPLDATGNIVLDPVTGQYGPTAPAWIYTAPNFHSQFVSSAQRLANGNTLICSGVSKRLFEVTSTGQVSWNYNYTGSGFLFQTHLIDRTLWTSVNELPQSGGQIDFYHQVDSLIAGHNFHLLGSLSGTNLGTPLPGGATLPLNFDFLTSAMLSQPNTGVFINTAGQLGGLGEATSSLLIPNGLLTGLAGLQLNFAHMTYDPALLLVRASNAVQLTITQ